jgi:molybdopterin molybdotransferase
VEVGRSVEVGRKISGNSVLLSGLLQQQGVCCGRFATVADRVDLIMEQLEEMVAKKPDMIISTGGMGPGKFDLMEQVVARMGGTVIYNRLQIRPGKATLFGLLGQVPFFALPGPPPAVRILFHELIMPALIKMQGSAEGGRELISAVLSVPLRIRQTGHMNLKGAVASIVDSGLQVRPAQRMEPINAIIHLDSRRTTARQGEPIRVRLVGSLQGLAM